MWLESRFRLCPISQEALVLHGGEEYGAPFLVERLSREQAVAWLTVGPAEANDPVAIGNRLAQAVNEAVEGKLLQQALPYLVHLRTLRLRQGRLPPFTLVVSGADLVPEFAWEAAQACQAGFGLWLLAYHEMEGIEAERLTPSELRLTPAEARQLAPAGIEDSVVVALLEQTEGAYTRFLVEMHRQAGLPDIVVPYSEGWLHPQELAPHEEPADVLEALVRLGRWIDALEVAVEHVPEQVEELLHEAGPAYQQQGLLQRLHLLLTALPAQWQTGERTLEWTLVAAHYAGSVNHVLTPVRNFLEQNEAPELRARFASFLPYEQGVKEAIRAARALPSPLTLWQLGRMQPDPSRGIEYLSQSVAQGELEGDIYACARSAGTLSSRYSHIGDFRSALSWASWGLQLFDEHELKDGVRRLHLFLELAFTRTMLGETSGLRDQLHENLMVLENVLPALAAGYRLALSHLERVEGDPLVAAELTQANFETTTRGQKGLHAYQHIRNLLELGRLEEAQEIADSATSLSAGVAELQDARARLAQGMVQSFVSPDAARERLLALAHDGTLPFEQRAIAALHYLLANPFATNELSGELSASLANLGDTALRVLSGPPEAFHEVWLSLTGGSRPPLELSVLGRANARLEGTDLQLTRRQMEILLALALHPDGLTYDGLHAFLLRDQNLLSPGTLRSHVSHLRSHVPVSDNPYRIEVPFSLDLARSQELLERGKVAEALGLVGGPVLPNSMLPGIRQTAEQFEQELRQSLLERGDAEALYSATGLWEDDLEVWEAAVLAMHPRDPRFPLLRAGVSRLREEYGLV